MTHAKIPLQLAYVWDCPHCGHENFQRAVVADISADELHDVAVAMGEIEEWQELPEGLGAHWQTHPDTVHCRRCETQYETLQEASVTDDEGDE